MTVELINEMIKDRSEYIKEFYEEHDEPTDEYYQTLELNYDSIIMYEFKENGSKYSVEFILETIVEFGMCPALLFNDDGYWALAFDGTQNIRLGDGPFDYEGCFWVKKEKWFRTIREAVDDFLKS